LSKKIKILMLIDEASMGGGQKHLLLLVQYLDKSRFEVEVACEEKGYLVDELQKMNIPIHTLSIFNLPKIKSIIATNEIVKKVKPDIIHSHGGTAGFYGRIVSLFGFRGGIVHTYHGIHYLNFKRRFPKSIFRFVDKLLLHLTDCIICVAQTDFDLGLKNGVVVRKKAVVIKNGIEIDKFALVQSNSNNNSELVKSDKPFVVGSVGRLHLQKGYEYLIKSADLILRKHPNVKFVIAGDGELRDELEYLCKSLNVDYAFRFLGIQTDLSAVISQFDIFVLPSLWEGLPLVLLEAMAAKKPIVATKVNGIVEIIDSGTNGILVPPKNPGALSTAIISLIEDGKLRKSFADNAFEKVNSEFNVTQMVKKTENIYLTIRDFKLC
jgi:glycosyltransferase involved in cell wall biosynthesis